MLKNSLLGTRRKLSIHSVLYGSQIKQKLGHFERKNEILRNTKSEFQRKVEAHRIRQKNLNKKAYTRQHAQHILKSKYDIQEKELDSSKVGPTSQSDLRFLTLTHDRRLLYTMLGVTGEQLRDSKLVADDVAKFLRRGQLEKALFLVRLARNKGVVGMNKIIEYYCKEMQDANSAIDIYTWRKKWGIPPNEHSHTILFDGLAKLGRPLTEKQAARILKIVSQLIEKDELNQISFNAALGCLINCINIDHVFKLYDMKPKTLINDKITSTLLLRAASMIKNDKLCMERTDAIMAQIPKKFLDDRVLYAYCKVWSFRERNQLSQIALLAMHRFFEIELKNYTIACPEGVELPRLDYWQINNRFPINNFVMELFLECCDKNLQYKLAIETFNDWQSKNAKSLTPEIYDRMIKIVTNGFATTCSQLAVQLFNDLEANFAATKNSMILVYKAFERQSGKKYTNDNSDSLNEMLENLRKFALHVESKHSDQFKCRVINWKAWIFCWKIINKGNERGKITLETRKSLLDEFIKTLLTAKLHSSEISKTERQSLRHIGLECVRFLSSFAEQFNIETTFDVKENGPLRDKFLFRRLLLRLKDRLLEYVELIEQHDKSIGETDSSLRDTAERLLKETLPDA